MKETKPEGAEFLRRLSIIILAIGLFFSVIGGIVSFGEGNFEGMIYAIISLIGTTVIYGICMNLASINRSLFHIASKKNENQIN